MVFGSSRCLLCSNWWLFLIPLFAFAGIALVFLLTVFNLTISIGTINGLIFYANIVRANTAVFFPPTKTTAVIIPNVFMAWLNLDLGIDVCFYHGLDTFAKTWLQLVFPVYVSIYSNSTQHPSHSPAVNWDRVTDSDISAYCTYIRDQLPIISEGLLNCCDPGCTTHYENIDSIYSSLLHTLKVGAERVFPSLILVCLEGLEFLVGIVKPTNLRSLRDFGINSGLTLVAHLLVCFSKSREMPNIGLSMRCEDLSVGVNISFVTILAMLSLIQDTRTSGRKLESSLGPLEGQDLMRLLLMVYLIHLTSLMLFLPNSKTSLILITSLNLDPGFWITLAPLSVALIFPV